VFFISRWIFARLAVTKKTDFLNIYDKSQSKDGVFLLKWCTARKIKNHEKTLTDKY
jgi:hypothetical protein